MSIVHVNTNDMIPVYIWLVYSFNGRLINLSI